MMNNNNNANATTRKNEEFDKDKLQDHMKKISHKLPKGHQPTKLIIKENDTKKIFTKQNLNPKELLYIKGCNNSEYKVATTSTKVLIEECENVLVDLEGKILTNIIEIWKCKNVIVNIKSPVYTAQVDICENIELNFDDRIDYHQVVWAGVEKLAINFHKAPEHNLITGLTQMKEIHENLNEKLDQFIVRFLENKLTTEMIVRLKNGFPTTVREADEFDLQKADNDRIIEEKLRKMISLTPQIGLQNIGKSGVKKTGRNDPCHCGSGLKYKKCCDNLKGNSIAKSVQELNESNARSKFKSNDDNNDDNNNNEQKIPEQQQTNNNNNCGQVDLESRINGESSLSSIQTLKEEVQEI